MHLSLQKHHFVLTSVRISLKYDSTLPICHNQKWIPLPFNNYAGMLVLRVQQFGISEQGLQSLRNLGIAAHPHTVKAKAKLSSASHSSNVASFIESAVENEQFLIFCIDDYHNIHTMHQPESKKQTNAIHMSTLLIKVFPNIKALCQDEVDLLPKFPVDISSMKSFISTSMHKISKTYSGNMPDWVVAKYFSPESRLGRFFGIPENTGFFEVPVFRFCKRPSTEKPKKDETPKKAR